MLDRDTQRALVRALAEVVDKLADAEGKPAPCVPQPAIRPFSVAVDRNELQRYRATLLLCVGVIGKRSAGLVTRIHADVREIDLILGDKVTR